MKEKRFERELEATLQSEKLATQLELERLQTRKSEGGTQKHQSSSENPIGSIESSWSRKRGYGNRNSWVTWFCGWEK